MRLATYSLLPIIQAFTRAADVVVETRDISLAGRILANFPDSLAAAQRVNDDLAELGELAKTPEANIIKLPNISASVPQLKAAIKELQAQGLRAAGLSRRAARRRREGHQAALCEGLGSAVNPVLREGNSDRRAAKAVKQYAKAHPHRWASGRPTRRRTSRTWSGGDFYGNEQSASMRRPARCDRACHRRRQGHRCSRKVKVKDGELIDATFMSAQGAGGLLRAQIADAKAQGRAVLAAPQGHHDEGLRPHHVRPRRQRLLQGCVRQARRALAAARRECQQRHRRPVRQDRAIAEPQRARSRPTSPRVRRSAPPGHGRFRQGHHQPARAQRRDRRRLDARDAIRASGQMWNADGKLQDAKAVIPDRCYAGVYQAVIDDCRERRSTRHAPWAACPTSA
jgi:isocitrate dehydrogenase